MEVSGCVGNWVWLLSTCCTEENIQKGFCWRALPRLVHRAVDRTSVPERFLGTNWLGSQLNLRLLYCMEWQNANKGGSKGRAGVLRAQILSDLYTSAGWKKSNLERWKAETTWAPNQGRDIPLLMHCLAGGFGWLVFLVIVELSSPFSCYLRDCRFGRCPRTPCALSLQVQLHFLCSFLCRCFSLYANPSTPPTWVRLCACCKEHLQKMCYTARTACLNSRADGKYCHRTSKGDGEGNWFINR